MIRVASKEESSVIPSNEGTPAIWAISGPALTGEVALLEERRSAWTISVVSAKAAGRRSVWAFDRTARVGSGIGKSLAFSRDGRRVGFLDRCKEYNSGPAVELGELCRLQILDVLSRSVVRSVEGVLDAGMSWDTSGRHLFYCIELLHHGERHKFMAGEDRVSRSFGTPDATPVVVSMDVESGAAQEIAIGWAPIISESGRALLVNGRNSEFAVVTLATHAVRPVNWPGNAGSAVAFDDEWVMFVGYPTAKNLIRWSTHNSPLVGRKQLLALKVSNPVTGAFETISNYVDPRAVVSYGPCPF